MPFHDSADARHRRIAATAKSRRKACNACIKAKRRCDLQHPSCRRCIVRGIECYYPSTRLHDPTPITTATPSSSGDSSRRHRDRDSQDGDSQGLVSTSLSSSSPSSYSPPFLTPSFSSAATATATMQQFPPTTHSLLYSAELLLLQGTRINPLYFLVPDSWTVASSEMARRNRIGRTIPQLNKSVHQVQCWAREWIEQGSNMFIHKNLYYHDDSYNDDCYPHGGDAAGLHMPKCIQDAYTSCAAYFACTTKNRKMALGIIEQRVATLLAEQGEYQNNDNDGDNGIFSTRDISDDMNNNTKTKSVLDHLARVQALLVYQLIRLYDGDIRSRVMAESLIPVLTRWCMQMLDSALLSSQYVYSMSTSMGPYLLSSSSNGKASVEKKLRSDWQAWILAESVRRTWLVAGHMQCIYSLLSYGINACPGGLMFTPRAGLWHAESAYEWWARCREKTKDSRGGDGLLFCQSLESGTQLLKKTSPEEVDDFGRFVLDIMAGEEKVNQWLSV
ncbi:hypothetical protein UA08_01999 [Talaromyces atroroseus]|uniref:Zn(2)-C6 fungal-type domain-containing protein n=1 Tax=Talaromyces atroroseus TaxID=1441469 RepID=A0A1Q5QAE0_TALAT|nr:hypothetical protein UA08_01999 [Talaromyces atroroseus]OKL62913.1 hypothetical protein UA08_01999 [Talaromyces atroroseus]